MAGTNGDISSVERKIEKLGISASESTKNEDDTEREKWAERRLWGFETRELYKMAVNFYKEKEGKAVHLSYEDKLKLVAFTQQVTHGKCTAENAPPLGVLDVIGRDRRLAWQNLGDISKEQAMEGFIVLLDKLCPLFGTVVEAQRRDIEEKLRLKKEEEARKLEEERRLKELDEQKKKEEEARLKEELQRRQIQDALNQQTYYQFKMYAEQQYPGNPEQQGVLIRQLQEQHYHQYMQQLRQNQSVVESQASDANNTTTEDPQKEEKNKETDETAPLNEEDSDEQQEDWPQIAPAEMWTIKGVEEFKETIRREAGDAVIKVGHGETVTVRVPTHQDGSCLFWEFATDGYDIGFGVYFEWSKPETSQVSVHISESEDEDEEDEDYVLREDLESGVTNGSVQSDYKPSSPPISVIVPVYRRDSQEEIYAGSHRYPGQGVYLLKFDNSYSLWRSKTLYYRVYYTQNCYEN
ncbi:PREDICTED: Golgi resident protein GCP60 [Dufourea novaeangliae]|uniref:Protein TMED8 n=1 Tax=Dufourea novaeangliae TaxID=178035 RepID=A0A154PNZ4_DUFNO|nr:PREDICTED: Golgi resident protein GCP60 [Dufourea novaeangliae]KZC13457.1 Protein TMED8 [Dufourea novaeangliae]